MIIVDGFGTPNIVVEVKSDKAILREAAAARKTHAAAVAWLEKHGAPVSDGGCTRLVLLDEDWQAFKAAGSEESDEHSTIS